jgi:hypothetical protein
MSGVEALALIGIIASTLQLASFSSQVLRWIKDYKDDTTTLPQFLKVHRFLGVASKMRKSLAEGGTTRQYSITAGVVPFSVQIP